MFDIQETPPNRADCTHLSLKYVEEEKWPGISVSIVHQTLDTVDSSLWCNKA